DSFSTDPGQCRVLRREIQGGHDPLFSPFQGVVTPWTNAISVSFNPYNSYTIASISRSVRSISSWWYKTLFFCVLKYSIHSASSGRVRLTLCFLSSLRNSPNVRFDQFWRFLETFGMENFDTICLTKVVSIA